MTWRQVTSWCPDPQPLPSLPDWQTEMRNKAVRDEREACARLAEEHGAHATAAEIRARGGVAPTPVGDEVREVVLRQVEPLIDKGFGEAISDFTVTMLRANPPPPFDPPDGGKWWPKVTTEERDGKTFARMTWEAKP